MSHIQDVVFAPGRTGFYFDDQAAIKAGAGHDGFYYQGLPLTERFSTIRMAGESILIQFLLDDGQVAGGDCVAVQYSGAGGRDSVFLAKDFVPFLEERVKPLLQGCELTSFRELAARFEALEHEGRPIHTAMRYGISQALLDAVAKARHRMPCQIIAEEYGLPLEARPVPIFVQSGDDRYTNVDKMIMKEADVLPHALFNNIEEKVGRDGGLLLDYVAWLRGRIIQMRLNPAYAPELHIDVYGTIGQIFNNDTERMADYLGRLAETAAPFVLRIEGPMDAGSRQAQCDALVALRTTLAARGTPVGLVADEWCNTLEDTRLFADAGAADMIQIKTPDLGGIQNSIEAVLYCNAKGVGAYLGGTCNETDRSARMCVHAALATRPCQMLAKPGMGVDEAFMVVYNEMQRALARLAFEKGTPA